MKQTINEAERNLASYEHLTPPERETKLQCESCGCDICVGERYWTINDEVICDECAKEWFSEILED